MGQITEYGESRDTWTPAGAADDRETATDTAAENRSTAEKPAGVTTSDQDAASADQTTAGLTTENTGAVARVNVTGDETGGAEAAASPEPNAGQGEGTPAA
jgi:hypothetical protein